MKTALSLVISGTFERADTDGENGNQLLVLVVNVTSYMVLSLSNIVNRKHFHQLYLVAENIITFQAIFHIR